MSDAPSSAAKPPFVMTSRDWATLVLCALCWGSAYTFNQILVAHLPSLTIATGRMIVASLFLGALAYLQGVPLPRDGKTWRQFAVFTMFSNLLPFLFVLHGQRETASGLAAVIGATTPVFVIVFAHFLTSDEPMVGRKVAGVIVGLLGVAVVVGPQAFDGWSSGLAGKMSLVFAAALYATGAIYSRRFVGIPALAMAATQMICGALVSFPLMLGYDQPWTLAMPPAHVVLTLIATGVIGSSISALAYFHLLKRAGATYAMLVTLLVPVAPIVLGALFFGERLALREIVGGLVIALALLIIDGRLVAWLTRRSTSRAQGKP